jgi:hypothetical protein
MQCRAAKERRTHFFRLSKELKNSTIDEEERNSGPALLMVVVCFRIAGCNLTKAVEHQIQKFRAPAICKDFCQ